MQDIRNQFPFFKSNPDLIYFDSATTTHKPESVIKTIDEFYRKHNANAGRSGYKLSVDATTQIEQVRAKVANYINARQGDQIIFTSGTTESNNTISYSWGLHNLKDGDEILLSRKDHKSNIAPWQNLQSILNHFGTKITLKEIDLNARGYLFNGTDINSFVKNITSQTRLIVLPHIHNIYGVDSISSQELKTLRGLVGKKILIALDASQSISHIPVDVQEMGIDFLSFSGHKMFAGTGVGVLYISENAISHIHPFMVGGQPQSNIKVSLESGTQNIPEILSLGAAIDFIQRIGLESMHIYVRDITQHLIKKLNTIDSIEFLPGFALCNCYEGFGIVSFNINGKNPNEIGFILEQNKILVRTGSQCSTTEEEQCIRVSLHIYNTTEEIDRFIDILKEVTV